MTDTTASSDNQTRLAAFMFLTFIFLVVEIVVGYITNSMALIADSFHMLSDVLALVIAFACVRMSPKKWSKNTFGWARAEILGALVNAVFLCALCFSILIESVKRFIKPDLIHDPALILIVGGLGLFINIIGLFLFKDGGHPHHHHHHGHGHGHHHHGHGHHHGPHKSDYKICQGDSLGENPQVSEVQKNKYGLLCKHESHSGSQDFFCHDHDHDDHSPSPDEHNDCDEGHLTSKAHQHSDKIPATSATTIHHQTSNKLNKTSENNSTTDIHLTFRQTNKQDYGSSTSNHRHVEVGCHDDHQHHHSHEDGKGNNKSQPTSSQMNMRGVFLHVMADALGSVIVMISALIVLYTDWSIRYYIDPILSVLMVMLMLKSTWPLLTESAMILLQTVPASIEVDSLRKRLTQEIRGVLAVHEFHVWQLAGNRIIASAHIRCHNLQDYMRIAEEVKEFFHNEGIHSTTIQPEFVDLENGVFDETNDADDCALNCPTTQRNNCAPQTCCGGQKSNEPINYVTNNEESSLTRRAKLSDQNRSGSSEVLDVSRLGQTQSYDDGNQTDTV